MTSSSRERVASLLLASFLAAALLGGTPTTPATAGGAATCEGEPATITGTDGDDLLVGTPGRDVVAGLAGDDTIRGRGGDDLLCGGDGADVLRGGAGRDSLHDVVVNSGAQRLDGGRGRDGVTFGWDVRDGEGEVLRVVVLVDLAAGRAVLGDTGTTFPFRSFREVTALVSPGRWRFVGTAAPEVVRTDRFMSVDARTRGGRDTVHGSWHDDRIRGGRGVDTAYPSRGRDVCLGVERGRLADCENLG
ncbi:calcium-binding protein [Nocardioides sp. GCM10027113]|uniref:calcium-binding protein n=1 Tax=unclassified Nocardioides TaxID=2615069 RepID=UPI003617ACB8